MGTDATVEPTWRTAVEPTPLELDLLRSWPVRRLAYVAHAGAASLVGPQRYSRLDHTLGLHALVCRFAPDDRLARAAALLHDVGHLPFSHTLEGLRGLDHHAIGAARVGALAPLLGRGGLDAGDVVDCIDGVRPSPLTSGPGVMKLDHLESYVRSGLVFGRTTESPPETLAALRLVGGDVHATDRAEYLVALMVEEARYQSSPENVASYAVLRDLCTRLLDDPSEPLADLESMTDMELTAALLHSPETAAEFREFLREPSRWSVRAIGEEQRATGIEYRIPRFCRDPPADTPDRVRASLEAAVAALPLRYDVHRSGLGA